MKATQRSVKIKIIFILKSLYLMHRVGRVKTGSQQPSLKLQLLSWNFHYSKSMFNLQRFVLKSSKNFTGFVSIYHFLRKEFSLGTADLVTFTEEIWKMENFIFCAVFIHTSQMERIRFYYKKSCEVSNKKLCKIFSCRSVHEIHRGFQ